MFFFHNYAKIKIDSGDDLHLEKIFTEVNIVMFIKSVLIKDQNLYYYNLFFDQLAKK